MEPLGESFYRRPGQKATALRLQFGHSLLFLPQMLYSAHGFPSITCVLSVLRKTSEALSGPGSVTQQGGLQQRKGSAYTPAKGPHTTRVYTVSPGFPFPICTLCAFQPPHISHQGLPSQDSLLWGMWSTAVCPPLSLVSCLSMPPPLPNNSPLRHLHGRWWRLALL